jgi:hypothetical protein
MTKSTTLLLYMDSVWKFVIKKEISKSCESVKGQSVCCINHIMAANSYRNRLSSQHNEALRALRKKPAMHAEHGGGGGGGGGQARYGGGPT